jgi:hypothetical protein
VGVRFTDNIDHNLQIIQDLLTELPPHARDKVRKIAKRFVDLAEAVRKDYPKDPTAGLGVAFAAHYIAQNLTQKSQDGQDTDSPLIQLLS